MTVSAAKWPGLLMALASAILFSTLAIFVKLAYLQNLSVNAVVVLRMVFASIFLVYLYPVLVVLIAYLLYRERPTRRKLSVVCICFLGCAMLSFELKEKNEICAMLFCDHYHHGVSCRQQRN